MVHPTLATAPVRPAVAIAAALSGVALSGLALGPTARSMPAMPAMPAPIAPAVIPQVVTPSAPPAPAVTAQPIDVPADELMLVFRVGGETYMRLADLKDRDEHDGALPVPPHGKLRLHRDKDDDITAAIGAVADRDVPVELGTWQGHRVEVDASCAATVVGFAVVSRRVGAPGHAGAAAKVLTSGHAVLAARLDRCVGSFARDAVIQRGLIFPPIGD